MKKKLRCVEDPGIVELAEGLKTLSDTNRLRIVCLLLRGEKCVCEVEDELGISQQLASHHLNVLKESGILRVRKEGTSSYYSVAEDKLDRVTDVFLRHLGYRDKLGKETDVVCGARSSRDRRQGAIRASKRGGAKKK